jgi:hypothetical protein
MPRHRGLSSYSTYKNRKIRTLAKQTKQGRAKRPRQAEEEEDLSQSEASSILDPESSHSGDAQSDSDSEPEFVLPRYPQYTKATRTVVSQDGNNSSDGEEHGDEAVNFVRGLHRLRPPERQTAMLKNGVDFCVEVGVLSAYALSTVIKLPAFIVCVVVVYLNLIKHRDEVRKQLLKPKPNYVSILQLLVGGGKNFVERAIQLSKHVEEENGETTTVYAPTNLFYSKPGPMSGASSSLYTEDHLYVLFTMMNRHIRFAIDRPANELTNQLRALEPQGQPIVDLVSYLESDVCFISATTRAKLLAVCKSSPGPLDVTAQTIYRMIGAFPLHNLGEVYYGDRTKIRSTGVSNAASAEARLKQKIQFAASMKINEIYRSFQQQHYQPDPGFIAHPGYCLPPQTCRLRVVFSDESWIAVGMRGERIWLSTLGEQPEVGNDKGIRFVLIAFCDKDGIHNWTAPEYNKIRDFFARESEAGPGSTNTKANTKKMTAAVQNARGETPDVTLFQTQAQKTMSEDLKRSFGRGGCYTWQISQKNADNEDTEDDGRGSYKSNVSSDNLTNIIAFQLFGAKQPTLLVLDNAAYHKKTGGFSPFAANVRLRDCEEFLIAQPADSKFGVFWANNSTTGSNCQVRSRLKKDQLIEKLKIMMDAPLSDLERKVAEIGMRQFGVPHRILFLPPRMPEWNPVEFIWAWVKHYYVTNRLPKVNGKGEAVGNQNVELTRQAAIEALSAIPLNVARNCFRHIQDTLTKFMHSSPEVEDSIDELTEGAYLNARTNNWHRSPTRSMGSGIQYELSSMSAKPKAGKVTQAVNFSLNVVATPAKA